MPDKYGAPGKHRTVTPEIRRLIERAMNTYEGPIDNLIDAIGVLCIGHLVGRQGIRLIMGWPRFNRAQKVLGIDFRDVLPERTPDSVKLSGIRIADAAGGVWKSIKESLASGPDARKIHQAPPQMDLF